MEFDTKMSKESFLELLKCVKVLRFATRLGIEEHKKCTDQWYYALTLECDKDINEEALHEDIVKHEYAHGWSIPIVEYRTPCIDRKNHHKKDEIKKNTDYDSYKKWLDDWLREQRENESPGKGWNDRWSEAIKNSKLNTREPMWEQAIKHIMAEGDMEGTMARELSQSYIQDIITEKGGRSVFTVIIDMSIWIHDRNLEDGYLVKNFTTGNQLWLAYLMAAYYGLFWNGEKWVNP